MATATCSGCGQDFRVKAYRLARNVSGLIYCSAACRQADGRTLGRPRAVPDIECPVCGTVFHRKPAERREVNYCSVSCSAKANMRLAPIAAGERRGVGTEFRAGQAAHNHQPVGSVTIRRRRRDGERRAWVKVAEPNVWNLRARVVWEAANGPVPDGMVVHHVNRDTLDDSLANLVLESRSGHLSEHRPEFEPKRRERAAAARWGTHAPSPNSDI